MVITDLGRGARLVIVPRKKFKTVLIRVLLRSDLDDRTTARSVLNAVLSRGTRRYPDLRAINRRLDMLYGAVLAWLYNTFAKPKIAGS